VGEGNKKINKLKKIIIGRGWGKSDTCTKENF
jgi:hypothetical protein